MYQPDTGFCFAGPCYAESLEALQLEVRDGHVVLGRPPGE